MPGGGDQITITPEVRLARLEREFQKMINQARKAAGVTENAFQPVQQGANMAERSVKRTSFATGNLAAQLNDIGVSLAGGQSPFQVMIQQGTQISQVFTQSGSSVKSFMSILGGAAMSMINPFTLATFALIGLGGVALQYFSSVWSSGEKTKDTLEDQVALIQRVADNWAGALPALKAYSDELERQQGLSDRAAAIQTAINMRWEEARKALPDVKDALGDIMDAMVQAGGAHLGLDDLRGAFNELDRAAQDLNTEMRDGTATVEDYDRVTAALAALQANENVSGHDAAAGAVARLAEAYFLATEAARNLAAEQAKLLSMENRPVEKGPRLKQPLTDKEFAGRFGYEDFFDMGDFDPPDPPKLGRGGSGGGRSRRSPADQYGETFERMQQRVTAMRAETAALSTLNPLQNDYGRTLAYVQTKQELLAEAKKRDIELTPDQVQAIEALASAMGDATAASAQLAEQQKKTQQTAQEFRDANQDLLKGFINDIRNGVSATEALENALGKVTDRLIDIALNNVFDNMGGGGGGGILGSIMGALGLGGGGGFKANTTLGSFLTKGFATGTANTGGRRGQVMGAVHGQEAVIPLPSGGRVPVDIKGGNNGPQRVHLIVEAEEGEMFRPVIRSESRNVSLQVTQKFNKAEKTKRRNGAAP